MMSQLDLLFRRILVIDDNASIHEDFQKILGGSRGDKDLQDMEAALFDEPKAIGAAERYEVDTASQGQEGFEKLKKAVEEGRPYGVAFVDVRMPPGWDGIETTEHLWSVDPNLQVVLCTAYSDYSWAEMTERLGGTDRLLLLKKPFENMEVLQLASTLTQKRQLANVAELRNRDLTALVEERTAALRTLAETDPLTRMANRNVFMTSLTQCIEERRNAPGHCDAVLFLDLDNFKLVNDSLGHGAGDSMLTQIADRIHVCTHAGGSRANQPAPLAARMGGDEFAVLLRNLTHPDEAIKIAKLLIAQLRTPIKLLGRSMRTSASVGIAMIGEGVTTAEDVLMQSDAAMYAAKSSGKNGLSVFDVTMHERAVARLSLESDIQNALSRQDFQLYCQPICELNTMKVRGFEALIRWIDEDGRVRSPAEFIPIAEETGQITAIGLWVIDKAAELAATSCLKSLQGDDAIRLSVNVARQQLFDPNFVDQVKSILREHDVPGRCFCFEITESTFIDDAASVVEVLRQLRALEIQIHLDDFGTGYSSLSCLHRYPIDVMKIDRSFVLGEAENAEAIIEALLAMAHALGMRVIAEGIETEQQLRMLKRLNCPFGQGYLFGRPKLLTHLVEAAAPQVHCFS